MTTLLAPLSLSPVPERTRAKFKWRMLHRSETSVHGLSVSGLGRLRRSYLTSNFCKLAKGLKHSGNLLQEKGGDSGNDRANLHIMAKAVRQRHNEIDKSEKLMEDPYGHVCDVMSQNVITMKCDELVCIKDAKNTIVWSMNMDVFEHYTGVPVVESNGNCVGVLTAADYENRVGTCRNDEWRLLADHDASPEISSVAVAPLVGLPVSAIMSTPAIVIKEHAPIAYAAALMLQNKVHRLPVADTNGLLVGIVTRTDIFEPLSEINPVYHVLAGKHRDFPEFTDE